MMVSCATLYHLCPTARVDVRVRTPSVSLNLLDGFALHNRKGIPGLVPTGGQCRRDTHRTGSSNGN